MSEWQVVSIVLSLGLIAQEWAHRRERKDLLNRIMAKDYGEYREGDKPPHSGHVGNAFRERLGRRQDMSVSPGGIDHGHES